jgi:hypothetical protein
MKIIVVCACAGLAAFAGFLALAVGGAPEEVKPVVRAIEAVPAPPVVAEPAAAPEVVTPVAAAPVVAEPPPTDSLQYERFSRSGHRIKKPVKPKASGGP